MINLETTTKKYHEIRLAKGFTLTVPTTRPADDEAFRTISFITRLNADDLFLELMNLWKIII